MHMEYDLKVSVGLHPTSMGQFWDDILSNRYIFPSETWIHPTDPLP